MTLVAKGLMVQKVVTIVATVLPKRPYSEQIYSDSEPRYV